MTDAQFAEWLFRRIPSADKRDVLVYLLESSIRAVHKTPLSGPWSIDDAMAYRMDTAYLASYLA